MRDPTRNQTTSVEEIFDPHQDEAARLADSVPKLGTPKRLQQFNEHQQNHSRTGL
jgi:hypothetical protein